MNPYTGRPDVENRHFEGTTSVENFSKYIGSMLPYFGKSVTNANVKEFVGHDEPKFLLFTTKKKPASVIKAITSRFRDRMHFGYVHTSQKEVVEAYSPPSIPCLLAVKMDGEHATFDGPFTFDGMAEFMEKHALSEKWEHKQAGGKISEIQKDLMVQQSDIILTPDSFDENMKLLNKVAFVHFHKGEDEVHSEWAKISEAYRDVVMTCTFDVTEDEATR
jgi:hypothetical protein